MAATTTTNQQPRGSVCLRQHRASRLSTTVSPTLTHPFDTSLRGCVLWFTVCFRSSPQRRPRRLCTYHTTELKFDQSTLTQRPSTLFALRCSFRGWGPTCARTHSRFCWVPTTHTRSSGMCPTLPIQLKASISKSSIQPWRRNISWSAYFWLYFWCVLFTALPAYVATECDCLHGGVALRW